jgi:hypothetical protein
MRILNLDTNEKINQATIYLTNSEAKELKDSLDNLLKNNSHHEHISDDSYQTEITVCIYEKNNLEEFDIRSRKLILDDE